MGRAANTFEELHIYQRARELTNAIYRAMRQGDFRKDFALVDQIRRACISILSNIAEGFERGSKTEFIQFLYIAKGSGGEVRAQLQIAADQEYLPMTDYETLHDLCIEVSKRISNFIAYLQGSDYKGEKAGRMKRIQQQKQKSVKV